MKLLTWNCNGALRNKFEQLSEFDADIYVIQECEDPAATKSKKYLAWADHYLWKGDNKNKGLGVFAKNKTKLELLEWSNIYEDHEVKHFLSCRVNKKYQLLNIWTSQSKSTNYGYIGQLWKYMEINKTNFKKIILAGDFNSNSIWDRKSRTWNHTDVVNDLSKMKITSLYHSHFNEQHGKETQATFFLHRNSSKPYHLDYIFVSKSIQKKVSKFEIGEKEKWLELSDHLPVMCEIG